MENVINRNAYSLLTMTEAEGASKLHLIRKIIFLDKLGELCVCAKGKLSKRANASEYADYEE